MSLTTCLSTSRQEQPSFAVMVTISMEISDFKNEFFSKLESEEMFSSVCTLHLPLILRTIQNLSTEHIIFLLLPFF